MSAASANLVELHNVTFGYGERVVLRDLSLTVPRGKVMALMGASGGGKTTVLRLIGGQNRAQQGRVLFDGQDVGQMDTAACTPCACAWGCCSSWAPCLPT